MPETAFLGAQIAPKSDSKGPTPKGRGREGRGGPRKIVDPEKFLRIGPAVPTLLKGKRQTVLTLFTIMLSQEDSGIAMGWAKSRGPRVPGKK